MSRSDKRQVIWQL